MPHHFMGRLLISHTLRNAAVCNCCTSVQGSWRAILQGHKAPLLLSMQTKLTEICGRTVGSDPFLLKLYH